MTLRHITSTKCDRLIGRDADIAISCADRPLWATALPDQQRRAHPLVGGEGLEEDAGRRRPGDLARPPEEGCGRVQQCLPAGAGALHGGRHLLRLRGLWQHPLLCRRKGGREEDLMYTCTMWCFIFPQSWQDV